MISRGNPIVEMALERFTSTYQGQAWAAAGELSPFCATLHIQGISKKVADRIMGP